MKNNKQIQYKLMLEAIEKYRISQLKQGK